MFIESICPCNELERFVIVLVIILESKTNLHVRKFLEVFNFSYTSTAETENFEKRFLGRFIF